MASLRARHSSRCSLHGQAKQAGKLQKGSQRPPRPRPPPPRAPPPLSNPALGPLLLRSCDLCEQLSQLFETRHNCFRVLLETEPSASPPQHRPTPTNRNTHLSSRGRLITLVPKPPAQPATYTACGLPHRGGGPARQSLTGSRRKQPVRPPSRRRPTALAQDLGACHLPPPARATILSHHPPSFIEPYHTHAANPPNKTLPALLGPFVYSYIPYYQYPFLRVYSVDLDLVFFLLCKISVLYGAS